MIDVPYSILVLIVLGLGALVIVLGIWVMRLERRFEKFMRGKNAQSLETTMTDLISAVETIHEQQAVAEKHRDLLAHQIRQSVRGVGLIRFNPFKDSGSNQSFALALIDEKGDGALISTLFSRERMSVFAKPLKNFSSEYELSSEEVKAVAKAQSSLI